MSDPNCKTCGKIANTGRYAVYFPATNQPEKLPLCEECWRAKRTREIAWRSSTGRDVGTEPIKSKVLTRWYP